MVPRRADFLAATPPDEPFAVVGNSPWSLTVAVVLAAGCGGFGGSLAASLRRYHPQARVDAALRAVRLSADTLVGEVWPEQWLALFRLLR